MNKLIAELQYITQDSERFSHAEQAKLMFEKGVKCVQIRMKNSTKEDIIAQAKEALLYARQHHSCLLINDSIEIAKEIGADGVHLGLHDTPIDEARKFLGEDFIIGGTANTLEHIILQQERGADYVGLGPFKHTTTKKNLSPIIGLEGYRKINNALREQNCNIPIVAVGGICMEDIESIKETGLFGVAISGALLQSLVK
jgi:thiamine-phosphate pyrophosphorylase